MNKGFLVRKNGSCRINIAATGFLIICFLSCIGTVNAQSTPNIGNDIVQLDNLVGESVDISPWAYKWFSNRATQEQPEAYFIPRRLNRIDEVYRMAYYTLPEQELKSIHYQQPDVLKPLLPKPKGELQAGLLWRGGLSNYQVELHWPENIQAIPSPEEVEVRVYPTSFGWFGWTVDKILGNPEISPDGYTWIYRSDPSAKMDWAFSTRVDAATEMVAVFYEEEKRQDGNCTSVPYIRVVSPTVGVWKRMDVEIEWGFQTGTEKADFDGYLETFVAMAGSPLPLEKDKGTTITEGFSWQSRSEGKSRRGIVFPLLYASGDYPALDSRVTVNSESAHFTFRPCDLENGPILIPEHGVFITKVGSGITAREFARELEKQKLKTIRQMTREHREANSWEEVMREVRLSKCPEGTVIPPLPEVEDPPMLVQVSDSNWTNAWNAASFQLKGKHMWGGLAAEVGRVANQMDLVGLHDEAKKVYDHFFKSPGVKADGDYVDANGSLEWATEMRHDMGYSHDGTHASTGKLLFAMADHYILTGDKEWFKQNRDRMREAADWIIRQRKLYMMNTPKREELSVAGLMPPCMLGDYALPACDWHWYYADNAFALQGLQRFADALMKFDAEEGVGYRDEDFLQYHHHIRRMMEQEAKRYSEEAQDYREDIRRIVDLETALSPVRQLRDGTYCSFIPIEAYCRGMMPSVEMQAPQRALEDMIMGALPLAEPFGVMDANDVRMVGTLDVMEELIYSDTVFQLVEQKREWLTQDEPWFWKSYAGLPKVSYNANIYLLQDDVPSFLRFWMNAYAAMVAADGRFWEWGHLADFDNCTAPDNGTAGWFMENFRNLLVMEDGKCLWLARATPRVWLEQGKEIIVKNAPTYFGTLAYEIVSDVDNGKINATVTIPDDGTLESVILRLRHPKAFSIKSVMVNGQKWDKFNREKELIELVGLTGEVSVTACY